LKELSFGYRIAIFIIAYGMALCVTTIPFSIWYTHGFIIGWVFTLLMYGIAIVAIGCILFLIISIIDFNRE
jgi:hypothetical protein